MSGSDGLLVANIAVLQDTGTINLASGCALAYDSSHTSTFNGAITGAGELQVGTSSSTGVGTLVLGGQNTYGGGTDIEQGEVQLENYSCLGADTGTLQLGTSGTLDLNGCPIVVGWLGNGNSPTGGAITDGSVLANSAYGGVTRFTVATSGLNDAFAGSIRDSHYPGNSFAAVRLVKSGTGMLTLGGYNTYTGGTEVDGGTLKLDSSSAFPHYGTLSVNYPGVFDMNDIGSTGSGFPTVIVGALDGNGTITDNHNRRRAVRRRSTSTWPAAAPVSSRA